MTPQTKQLHNSDGYSPASYRVGPGSFTVRCFHAAVVDRWKLWHFWHVYILGKVYPLQISLTETRDVIAALTLALATYTHVWARNAEGKGESQYIRRGAD